MPLCSQWKLLARQLPGWLPTCLRALLTIDPLDEIQVVERTLQKNNRGNNSPAVIFSKIISDRVDQHRWRSESAKQSGIAASISGQEVAGNAAALVVGFAVADATTECGQNRTLSRSRKGEKKMLLLLLLLRYSCPNGQTYYGHVSPITCKRANQSLSFILLEFDGELRYVDPTLLCHQIFSCFPFISPKVPAAKTREEWSSIRSVEGVLFRGVTGIMLTREPFEAEPKNRKRFWS